MDFAEAYGLEIAATKQQITDHLVTMTLTDFFKAQ